MNIPSVEGIKACKESAVNAAHSGGVPNSCFVRHPTLIAIWIRVNAAGSVEPRILAEERLLRGLASNKRPEANGFVYPLFPLSVKELLELWGVLDGSVTLLSPMFAAR